ncbi:MAG TPA: hypothetical protein VJZ76_00190 [Thermoanaerobaculia bacterium]|nr:hypothetical protein [Thermoanaerobaculia bacterium]
MESGTRKPLLSREEVLVIIAGIALAVGAFFVVKSYSLWILVPIPAAIGLVYHLLNLSSKFDSRMSVVEAYRQFTEKFDQTWSDTANPIKVSEDLSDDMSRHAPTFASMLWGAALLTAVFSIPAVISDGGNKLTPASDPKLSQVSTTLKDAQSAAAAATPSIATIKTAIKKAQDSLAAAQAGLPEWQLGLVYSGFGVWVLLVMRMIGRINAGGLSARFLITASLRAGAAMMLGFFAGATDVLKDMTVAGPSTYFLIGMFYPLFFEQLRDEAYKRFKRNKSITSELPTNWIDGVDDDTADILTELNVLSVQHLATSDPGVLTVRSLFPFTRVIDLVDQAILVSYFRDNIVKLRKFEIRGVIDFVSTIEPIIRNTSKRAEAEKVVAEIAKELDNIPVETLMAFGRSIFDDYRVNLLMRLWQHNVQPDGKKVERVVAAIAPADEARIPIAAEPAMSFGAFVNRQIELELAREAKERAASYREANPDATEAADADLKFDEAYAAAVRRATVGANPKASARAKEAYKQAFQGALTSS